MRVWRMQSDDTKAYEIKLVHEITMSSPPKSACMMADGVHVCAGAFDGSVFMWDTEVLRFFSFFFRFFRFPPFSL